MLNQIFKEEMDKPVLVYLDDILVYSKTMQEQIHHIRETLDRLRRAKLYARLHKCEFFQTRVDYLGYDVSAEGICPSKSKVTAVVEMASATKCTRCSGNIGAGQFLQAFH